MVHPVIKFFVAQCEGVVYFTRVKFLILAGHSTGFVHVPVSIDQHLGPSSQVFKISLTDHLTKNVGHSTDP